MSTFAAVYIREGLTRKIWFEAASFDDAKSIAAAWCVGLLGQTDQPELKAAALPEAYDEKTARQLLGGISRTTLYREVRDGKLRRVAGTHRLLVTRASLEERVKWNPLARRKAAA